MDIELFRRRKADVIEYVTKNSIEEVSFFCSVAGIPLVAAFTFIKEEYPDKTKYCDDYIAKLKEFYNYED